MEYGFGFVFGYLLIGFSAMFIITEFISGMVGLFEDERSEDINDDD